MCGIFGAFARAGLAGDLGQLTRANDLAAYRGPDSAGTAWFDTRRGANAHQVAPIMHERWTNEAPPTLMLGHRRLAIIDLSAQARQPMATEDESLWITYNGELYNFIELRAQLEQLGAQFRTHSDTEVVLKAYEIWGDEAVTKFVGMWAFALLDLRRRRLLLSRDRYGIKPLHYHTNASFLTFASEIKQLLAVGTTPRRINERAIYDYLRYEADDTGPETFFGDIYKVRPGHNLIMSLDDGGMEEVCYYVRPNGAPTNGVCAELAAEQFRELLKESVRVHLRSDVAVGTCLSGGLDSSSIAMLMREVALEAGLDVQRHSFSCHFDAPEANELEYTRAAIEASGVIAHFVQPTDRDIVSDLRKLVWHQDEPFGSTSIYAQWSVFRLVHQTGIKVVLDGQGADEMLGGYASLAPYFFLDLLAKGKLVRALWESRRWAQRQGIPWSTQLPLSRLREGFARLGLGPRPASGNQESWIRREFETEYAAKSQYARNVGEQPCGDDEHFANVLHRFFFLGNLTSLLRYEDRNSMAFSVEARVPFLDHRLVDFAFSLPSNAKMRDGYTKRVLRDAMAGSLPERIRLRARKMGFATPERQWQSGALRSYVMDAIEGGRLSRYIAAEKARRHYARVVDGGGLSFAPWRWVNLSLWMDEFNLA